MGTSQIILLALYGVSLLCSANLHGKEKKGKYNFWLNFTSAAITLSLLYWGGFFK